MAAGHRVSRNQLTAARRRRRQRSILLCSLVHAHTLNAASPCLAAMSAIRFLGSTDTLGLIRVIETGPPETKEPLNCCPFTHLKEHLIKPLCVYMFYSHSCSSLQPPPTPTSLLSYFSFLNSLFFPASVCQVGEASLLLIAG